MKKYLKHLKKEVVGSIFINTSLCPYYCMHDFDKICNFYISTGTVKVKISENRNLLSITHTQDFVKYFPVVIYYQPSNIEL